MLLIGPLFINFREIRITTRQYSLQEYEFVSAILYQPQCVSHPEHIEAEKSGRHFADDISKFIVLNESCPILSGI